MLNAIAAVIATASPASADDAAVLDVQSRFVATWNRGDADGLAAFFTDDAVRVGASGDIAHGKKEIAASFTKLFKGAFAGATVKLTAPSVRFLADGVALCEGSIAFPEMEGYVVDVMVKRDGKWLILESHPKLFPAKPLPVKTGVKAGGMSLNDTDGAVVVKTGVKAGGLSLNDSEPVVVTKVDRASPR